MSIDVRLPKPHEASADRVFYLCNRRLRSCFLSVKTSSCREYTILRSF